MGDSGSPSVTPGKVAEWVELLLFVADRILRLFGRRATDRPDRDRASAEPEGPAR